MFDGTDAQKKQPEMAARREKIFEQRLNEIETDDSTRSENG